MRIGIVCLALVTTAIALDYPNLWRDYDSPCLPPQDVQFVQEAPESTFFAYTSCDEGRIIEGYPHHSGMVKGVNDTCYLALVLDNRTLIDRDIRYLTPQNWVTPVIYRSFGDMQHNRIEKDTSGFNWAFSHWERSDYPMEIVRPDTLQGSYSHPFIAPIFKLMFKIWNVPVGLRAVELKKTSQAPSWISFIRYSDMQYWFTEGKDMRDTINAYILMSGRAWSRHQFTQSQYWFNQIFAKEDSSLAGWNWAVLYYIGKNDSLNVIQSCARVKSIYENNHDPLFDLSGPLTKTERHWAEDYYKEAVFWKWAWETGNQNRHEL